MLKNVEDEISISHCMSFHQKANKKGYPDLAVFEGSQPSRFQ